jgi:DNA-directed RNA polymerase subunit omega
MLPSPDILNEYSHGKFVLSNLAAKRAKQLREGAPALVQIDSNHPLTIALAEIAAGKIKPIMPNASDALVVIEEGPSLLVDETMPPEFGMLLPALDETEAALVSAVVLEEDHEAEPEGEDVLSLSDLVEDEEAATAASDDDTLSLSDIADAETADEEEEAEEG